MGHIWRGSRTLLVMAALLLAAACGGQKAAEDPPATHTSSPTVSASPSVPVMPALATEHTLAGAKAFVEYYFAVADYTLNTLDVAPLQRLASPGCAGCNGAVKAVKTIAKKGGHSVGGATTVSDLSATALKEIHNPVQVDFTVTSEAETITYPGGQTPTTSDAGALRLRFILTPTPSAWTVGYWGQP